MAKKLPKSARKHLRQQKARIRREGLNIEEEKKQVSKLYQKFLPISAASPGDVAEETKQKTD